MLDSMIEAFIAYFTCLLGIGSYFYYQQRRINTTHKPAKLNYWVTALTAQASDMSDWLFMGFPGAVYASGCITIWTAYGLVLFMFLTWHYIAPRFKIATEKTESLTLASFLQTSVGAKNNHIRIVCGLLCLYFFTFYIAANLVGLGKIFESAFSINYYAGILLGLGITLTYTLLGGLMAVAWSNLLQGIFLLIAIMIVPIYATMQLGGVDQIIAILSAQSIDFLSCTPKDQSYLSIIFGITTWGLGYFGQPHILQSFMTIDDVANMKKAKIVGISWQILVLTAALCVGIVGKAFIIPTLEQQEMVFIVMVKTMFSPFFAGLILCAMLAATISTINTMSLVSAMLITHDLYFPFRKKIITEQEKIWFTHCAIFIIPLLSLTAAWHNTNLIMNLVHYAWSGLGCTFGPLIILVLYTKYITPTGALVGLITGGIFGIFWPLIANIYHITIPTLVVGFIAHIIVTIYISHHTKKEIL